MDTLSIMHKYLFVIGIISITTYMLYMYSVIGICCTYAINSVILPIVWFVMLYPEYKKNQAEIEATTARYKLLQAKCNGVLQRQNEIANLSIDSSKFKFK